MYQQIAVWKDVLATSGYDVPLQGQKHHQEYLLELLETLVLGAKLTPPAATLTWNERYLGLLRLLTLTIVDPTMSFNDQAITLLREIALNGVGAAGAWDEGDLITGDTAVASLIIPLASDAERYLITGTIKATSNGAVLQSRVQTAGGVQSGAGTHAYVTVNEDSNTEASNRSNSTSVMNLAYNLETTYGVNASIEVIGPHDTTRRTFLVGAISGPTSGGAIGTRRASGIYLATTEVTGLQLFMSSGNIAADYALQVWTSSS